MKALLNDSYRRRFEKYFFLILIFANATPLLYTYYIGSLDGPKHIQIANIIKELWMGNPLFDKFFEFSPYYTANVLSHYILAFERLLLPAWLSEKLLLLFYVIMLPIGFRYLVFSLTTQPGWGYFLILPTTYTSLFFLGFYNYSLAYVFLFLSIGYYVRNHRSMNWRKMLILMCLILLTYYSHFFVYGFLMIILGLIFLHHLIFAMVDAPIGKRRLLLIQKIRDILLPALPSLIMALAYFDLILRQPTSQEALDFDRWNYLVGFRMLIGFIIPIELPMTTFLFWVVLAIFTYTAVLILIDVKRSRLELPLKNIIRSNKFLWTLITLFFFLLYFLMPNSLNAAGNILTRIIIMALYILLIWLSLRKNHYIVNILIVIVILVYAIVNYQKHIFYRMELDKTIVKIKEIEDKIPENSVIACKNYLDSWNAFHFQSYIGTDKPFFNINSLAISPLFAVKWKEERPQTFIGTKFSDAYTYFINVPNASGTFIADFIAITGKSDFEKTPDSDKFKSILIENYQRIAEAGNSVVVLYRLDIEDELIRIQDSLRNDIFTLDHIREVSKKIKVSEDDLMKRKAIEILNTRNEAQKN